MNITPFPPPPTRGDPVNFASKADAFVAAFPQFVTEANALAAALGLVEDLPPRGFYSVKDAQFGAVGNGIADDTAAINAAITAARNAGDGGVFLPAGGYKVSGPIVMKTGVTLFGCGFGSEIVVASGASFTDNIIKLEAVVRAHVRDFTINGNRSASGGGTRYGIYLGGATECSVQGIHSTSHTGVGIHVYDSARCLISGNVSRNNVFHGIEIEQTRDTTVIGNVCYDNDRHGIFLFEGEVGASGSHGVVFFRKYSVEQPAVGDDHSRAAQ